MILNLPFVSRGLDNAGKSTITKKLKDEPIDQISPTLGFSIKTMERNGYKLNLWDVGGQKSLRSFWKNYFECTDGLIWVIDSADKRRLEDCKEELHKLLQEERLLGASLLIFANKQDLPGAMSADDIAVILDLQNIKTHHWKIYKSSAFTGENLIEGIEWIIQDISSRVYYK